MNNKRITKKSKLKNVLSWIIGFLRWFLGIFFGFGALTGQDIVTTIILVILSIILIPPFFKLVKKLPNFIKEMKNKRVFIFVAVIVIVTLIIIIKFGKPPETTGNEWEEVGKSWNELGDTIAKDTGLDKFKIESIKDISQNQEEYWLKNETIKIKGSLGYSIEIDYYLEDSEGYYVLINQASCIGGTNRHPKVGEDYTFEGKLLKNNYNYYRLFCNDNVDTGYYN